MDNKVAAKVFINFYIGVKNYVRAHIRCGSCSSMTEQQFRTLIHLRKLGRSSLKELSEDVHVSTSSLCIMLNKMVEVGYVMRETDSRDRRNTFYYLSEKGEDFLNVEYNKKVEVLGEKMSKLSEQKKERLVKLISELDEIIEEIK